MAQESRLYESSLTLAAATSQEQRSASRNKKLQNKILNTCDAHGKTDL